MSAPDIEPAPARARRVGVGPDRLARWLDGFMTNHGHTAWTTDTCTLHGVAEDGAQVWITVPFPPLPETGPLPQTLVEHATRRRRIGVVLVRRGGYAAGVFHGSELVASKVGSSYVQGTTKAGGWSQQRFARRRANQARAAFADAAEATVRVVLPRAGELDAVITGGDRGAIDVVLGDPRLAPLAGLITGAAITVVDPRLRVLQAAPEKFLAVSIALVP